MWRCLRMTKAYSFRMSRRHSTILLITGFLFVITLILHLYSSRHRVHSYNEISFGDFDYKPGSFLRGMMPKNYSYCKFNYGLPDKLDFNVVPIHPSPELGWSGHYRVIYDAIKGSAYSNVSNYDAVTYSTQATPEFLYHIVEIARYWDGPISLSIYVPGYDLNIAMQIMKQLCSCYEDMSKVSVHLFYHKRKIPKISFKRKYNRRLKHTKMNNFNISDTELINKKVINFRNLNNLTRAEYIKKARQKKAQLMMLKLDEDEQIPKLHFPDCAGPADTNFVTYRKQNLMFYPINVGRNVARNASTTNYFIVSDIEMVPSEGLAVKFLAMLRELMTENKRKEGCVFLNTVFVVPLFEVVRGEPIPRDKDTLVHLVENKRAKYFHQKICSHCQRFPALQSWLARPSPVGLECQPTMASLAVMDLFKICILFRLNGDITTRSYFVENITLIYQTLTGVSEARGVFITPMVISKREYPYHRWEPLYFGTKREPWYNEVLSWEGKQDKMAQMLELCLRNYRLAILDGGFLCHAASLRNSNWNSRARYVNYRGYMDIIKKLKVKYGDKPWCIVR